MHWYKIVNISLVFAVFVPLSAIIVAFVVSSRKQTVRRDTTAPLFVLLGTLWLVVLRSLVLGMSSLGDPMPAGRSTADIVTSIGTLSLAVVAVWWLAIVGFRRRAPLRYRGPRRGSSKSHAERR